jgi:hypothetical protein
MSDSKHDVSLWAMEKRRALLADIERLQAQIKKYEAFLEVLVEYPGSGAGVRVARADESSEPSAARPPLASVADDSGSDSDGGSVGQAEFVRLGREIILKRGAPMQGPELARAFRDLGRPIGGANEQKNITTKLIRAKDVFHNIRGRGYWLKDLPSPVGEEGPTEDQIREIREEFSWDRIQAESGEPGNG